MNPVNSVKKFRLGWTALVIACLVMASPALAARKRAKKVELAPPPPPKEEVVPVPQSILEFSRAADASVVVRPANVEVAASNWAPEALTSSAYNPATASNFHRDGMPMLTINRWRSVGASALGIEAVPKYGFSFNQLSRSGTVPLGAGASVSQTMNLFSARLGFELKPEKDLWGWLVPFVDVSVLPSWAVFASSEMSDGSSSGLIALEEVAGLAVQVPALGKAVGLSNFGLEVGIQAIQGVSGPSGMNGVGVIAGTRVEL